MSDLLTAVTRGFKNSASLVNSARRLEGSYDTHTHTHTRARAYSHLSLYFEALNIQIKIMLAESGEKTSNVDL